jgi:CMP-N-acetylneuraminic acid synthetase
MLIAVIPARGASKGIPNKNLRQIGGRSLVQIAADFALSCLNINKVIVSTDSVKIAHEFLSKSKSELFENLLEGKSLNVSSKLFLHKRRHEQARDSAKTVDTVIDIIKSEELHECDWILLLQPTSPFRDRSELDQIIQLATSKQVDACVSARLFDSPHPEKAFTLESNMLLDASKYQNLLRPRQDLGQYYVLDGSFYLSKVSSVIGNQSLISRSTAVFLRSGIKTINIDNQEDLEIAASVAHRFAPSFSRSEEIDYTKSETD